MSKVKSSDVYYYYYYYTAVWLNGVDTTLKYVPSNLLWTILDPPVVLAHWFMDVEIIYTHNDSFKEKL